MDGNTSIKYCPGENSSHYRNVTIFRPLRQSPVSNLTNYNGTIACNCTRWYDDTVDAEAIAIIRIIVSSISIIGSASIILSVLLRGKLNKAEVHPLFILSVADFILSILWMIGGVVWLSPGEGGWATKDSDPHTGMCYVLGVSTSMAAMVTFFLTVVYAQNAFIRVLEMHSNKGKLLPDNDYRKRFRYIFTVTGYILSWILPLIIFIPTMESMVGIESTNFGCWCILDFFNLRPDDGLEFGESHFNEYAQVHASVLGSTLIVTAVVITIIYVLTFIYARKVLKQQEEGLVVNDLSKTRKLIKMIVIRLTAFTVIFMISGLPSFIACIDIWKEKERLHLDEDLDRVVLFLHALLAPLQGFLNAIVYGWSRKEFRRALNVGDWCKSTTRGYESVTGRLAYSRADSMDLNHAPHT